MVSPCACEGPSEGPSGEPLCADMCTAAGTAWKLDSGCMSEADCKADDVGHPALPQVCPSLQPGAVCSAEVQSGAGKSVVLWMQASSEGAGAATGLCAMLCRHKVAGTRLQAPSACRECSESHCCRALSRRECRRCQG